MIRRLRCEIVPRLSLELYTADLAVFFSSKKTEIMSSTVNETKGYDLSAIRSVCCTLDESIEGLENALRASSSAGGSRALPDIDKDLLSSIEEAESARRKIEKSLAEAERELASQA